MKEANTSILPPKYRKRWLLRAILIEALIFFPDVRMFVARLHLGLGLRIATGLASCDFRSSCQNCLLHIILNFLLLSLTPPTSDCSRQTSHLLYLVQRSFHLSAKTPDGFPGPQPAELPAQLHDGHVYLPSPAQKPLHILYY